MLKDLRFILRLQSTSSLPNPRRRIGFRATWPGWRRGGERAFLRGLQWDQMWYGNNKINPQCLFISSSQVAWDLRLDVGLDVETVCVAIRLCDLSDDSGDWRS